jgi:hypothetical protein
VVIDKQSAVPVVRNNDLEIGTMDRSTAATALAACGRQRDPAGAWNRRASGRT